MTAGLITEAPPLVTYVATREAPWAVTSISPRVEALLGFPPAVWTERRRSWLEHMVAEDRDRFLQALEDLGRADEASVVEYRMLAADGRVVWIRDTAVLAHDEDGAPIVQGFLRDLTHEKETELHYRRLVEQLPLVTYVNQTAPVWRAIFVSPQIEELFGYPAGQWLADPELGDRVIHPDDVARVRAAERRSRETGQPFELEYRIVRADGAVRWVLDLMQTVVDDDNTVLYEQGFLVDVTDRKESEDLLRAVFEGSLDGIIIVDDEARFVDANAAACAIFGRSKAELLALKIYECGFAEGGAERFARFLSMQTAKGTRRLERPDGTVCEIEFSSRVGVLPGRHLSVLRDVSERARLERALAEAQKLESVGRLAGGIAHDFNNMLTAISGYVHLLRATLDERSIEREHVEEIARAAARATRLTGQLLAFGRRQMLQPRPLALNELVGSLAAAIQRMIGEHIELRVELEPELPATTADGTQIEQLLLNLALNGAEAMPAGGRLTIRTETAERLPEGLAEGRYLALSVSDTGVGIDAEVMAHLFEPFFTTKEVGRGVGLGLATAYGIAQQSGGTIVVESVPGTGSTFTVLLPLTPHGPNGGHGSP